MKKSPTKPKGSTSYKETAFGIIPRSNLLKLELEGTKKGLEYLHDLIKQNKEVRITPELICKLHKVAFGWIFPNWGGKYRSHFQVKKRLSFTKYPNLFLIYVKILKKDSNIYRNPRVKILSSGL